MTNKVSLQRLTRNAIANKDKTLLTNILQACEERAKEGRGSYYYYVDPREEALNNKVATKLRSLGFEVEYIPRDEQIKITWDQATEDRRDAERGDRIRTHHPIPVAADPEPYGTGEGTPMPVINLDHLTPATTTTTTFANITAQLMTEGMIDQQEAEEMLTDYGAFE